jgi:hypothetical protein
MIISGQGRALTTEGCKDAAGVHVKDGEAACACERACAGGIKNKKAQALTLV